MPPYQLKPASGTGDGETIELQAENVIGSGPGVDVTLAGESIAARHARITLDEDGLLLESLDEVGQVFVNGEPVSAVRIGAGDEIRIGQQRFMVKASGMKPRRVLAPAPDVPQKPKFPWGIAITVTAALAAAAAWAWQAGYLG